MKRFLGSKKNVRDELTSIYMVKEQAQLHLDNNIDNHNSVRTWRLKLIRRKKMVKGYLHHQKTKCKTAYN